MAVLTIASKANQAILLPALLVAARVNELDPNAAIKISFEDVGSLKAAGEAAVKLMLDSGDPTYGANKLIFELLKIHRSLQSKHEDLVSCTLGSEKRTTLIVSRSRNGSNARRRSILAI